MTASFLKSFTMESYASRSGYLCLALTALVLVLNIMLSGCSAGARRSGIPADAQSVLDSALEDIDAGRYDKVYQEAADEWRNQVTQDESRAKLQAVRDSMGKVRTRTLHSAREEQTSTAPVAGHSLTAFYQSVFERASGMEAVVLVEHGGHWYLAKYYVTSSGAK
jgi:hypothetical protein